MNSQRTQFWPQMGVVALALFAAAIAAWLHLSNTAMMALIHDLQQPVAISWPALLATVMTAIIAMGLSAWLLYVPGGRDTATHVEGPRLFHRRAAHRHARHQFRQEQRHDTMGDGIHLHPQIPLSKRRELGNLFVYGQQGSGKGVVLKPIVAEILDRGDRALVYDHKREYTPLFANAQTILISPTEAGSAAWNIADDARTIEQAQLIAERLIPATQEPIWAEGSRLILVGCITILNAVKDSWGWYELAGILAMPEKELRALLDTHYPEAARFVEENSKTSQGFFITLMSNLSWIRTLSKAWPQAQRNGFSIRRWLADEDARTTIIVTHDARFPALSGALCNALFSLMVSQVLALPDSDERRIWFVLDELAALPGSGGDSLESWMALGRSKGARTLAGTQQTSQLRELYGEQRTETLLSLFASVICLRLGTAGQSAEAASQGFGQRVVERPTVSIDHQGQRSVSYQRSEEPLVRPEQIVHLPQANRHGVEGFLSVAGWEAVYQLRWPHQSLPETGPAYQAASWLTPPAKVASRSQKSASRRLKRRAAPC